MARGCRQSGTVNTTWNLRILPERLEDEVVARVLRAVSLEHFQGT